MTQYIKRLGLLAACFYVLGCQPKAFEIKHGKVVDIRKKHDIVLVQIKNLDSIKSEDGLVKKINDPYLMTFTKEKWDTTVHKEDDVYTRANGDFFMGFMGDTVIRNYQPGARTKN